jgi:hypothetical protein
LIPPLVGCEVAQGLEPGALLRDFIGVKACFFGSPPIATSAGAGRLFQRLDWIFHIQQSFNEGRAQCQRHWALLPEAKEAEDGNDHYHQTDYVDDAVHEFLLLWVTT